MLETVSAIPQALGNASPTSALSGAVNVNPLADWLEGWISSSLGLSGLAADALSAAAVLAVFIVLSLLVKYFVTDVAPHLVSKTGSSLDDELLKSVKGPAQVLIIVAGIYLACKTLNGLSSGIIDIMASIVLIFVAAYFIANVISGLIRWYIRDVAPKTESDLDDHLMPFLSKFLVAAVYVVALVMAVGLFTPITPLIAGLGVFGIAVAFAAKEMLANLFGAFAILTDRPYKVGDRLCLEGIGYGDVDDIGMRSTRVRTVDNRVVIVPNEKIASGRIVNLSRPDAKIRLDLKVGIGYGSDADKACALLENIASETPVVSRDPRPRAYVSELSDFAVVITFLVWIDDYREYYEVPDAIYRRLLVEFKKEGIEIPFPTMTIVPK
jgi:MscS family membrane protein